MDGDGNENIDALFGFGGLLDSSIEEIDRLLLNPHQHTSSHSPVREDTVPRHRRRGSEGNLRTLGPFLSSGDSGENWGSAAPGNNSDMLARLHMNNESIQRLTAGNQDREGRGHSYAGEAVAESAMGGGAPWAGKASYLLYLEEQQRLYTTLLEKEKGRDQQQWNSRPQPPPPQRIPVSRAPEAMHRYQGYPEEETYQYHHGPQPVAHAPPPHEYRKMGSHPPGAMSGGYAVDGRYPHQGQHGHPGAYSRREPPPPPPHYGGHAGGVYNAPAGQHAGVQRRPLPRSHTWSNGSRTVPINAPSDRINGAGHPNFRHKATSNFNQPPYVVAEPPGFWRGALPFEPHNIQHKGISASGATGGNVQTGGLKILVVNMQGCLRTYAEVGGSVGDVPADIPPMDPPPTPEVIAAMAVSSNRRAKLYDLMSKSAAHIILMVNTGCSGDEDLKTIRSEVKSRFKTESAMWASFCSPIDPPCTCSMRKPSQEISESVAAQSVADDASQAATSRGTGVLILGPLAPRAGWVRSDAESSFSLLRSMSSLEREKRAAAEAKALGGQEEDAVLLPSHSNETSRDKSSSSVGSGPRAHGLKYTLATVRIKAGFSDVVFVSCELPLPLPSCSVRGDCNRIAQWKKAVSELASVLFEEQKKGKNVYLSGRVIPPSKAMKKSLSSITHVNFLQDFLEIMAKGGVFLLVVSHNGIVDVSHFAEVVGDMGDDGVSVFFSAGTIPQQQHLAPVSASKPTAQAGMGGASSRLSVSTSAPQVAGSIAALSISPKGGRSRLQRMSESSDSNSSIAELYNEDDIFAISPKNRVTRQSPKYALNANATPYMSSFSFSKSDIGDSEETSNALVIKGSYNNMRSHLLNLNGPCPHDSFIRSIKCGVMNISDHVKPDEGSDAAGLGTVLELNVEIKGWPRKTFEFMTNRLT